MLSCLHHILLQLLFFLLVNNTICFSWLSIFEHLFFNYFTSCGNISIHHIHIHSDYLCLNNRLNLCYCHRFPMKHFLHLHKLWTICHFIGHSNHRCDMHMKMSPVFFDLVVLPLWLPPWSIFFSFYMSSHCDLSSHNLCNVC